jgi:hypothetical protein
LLNSCERCRRQKIKCSGKEPCTACQKRRLVCNFDEQNQKILVTRELVLSVGSIEGLARTNNLTDIWLNLKEEPDMPLIRNCELRRTRVDLTM